MKLHYREMGEGQAFIILHGLFGYSDNWQTHAKKLSEYYRVILVDQRNHGHSPWSDAFSYEIMADDLAELVDDLQLSSFILMGHSMGGKTAMHYVQKYPSKVEKLLIVDMGLKEYPMHHSEILKGLYNVPLHEGATRAMAEEALSVYIDSPGIKQFLLKNLYWKEKNQLAWRMNIPVLEKEMPEILKALPEKEVFTNTLFIRGELSNYILDEDFEAIENQFPDCHIITIEGAGHWVHAEKPHEFIHAVLEFCLR